MSDPAALSLQLSKAYVLAPKVFLFINFQKAFFPYAVFIPWLSSRNPNSWVLWMCTVEPLITTVLGTQKWADGPACLLVFI